MLPLAAERARPLGRGRFELKARFLARAMGVRNSEVAAILALLEEQGLVTYDGQSITILDAIGLRRLTCSCYAAMKRAYAPDLLPRSSRPPCRGRRPRCCVCGRAAGACTLCGSSTHVPHQNGHACILAHRRGNRRVDSEDAHAPQVPRATDGQSRSTLPRHPETIERTHKLAPVAYVVATSYTALLECPGVMLYLSGGMCRYDSNARRCALFERNTQWLLKIFTNCSSTN